MEFMNTSRRDDLIALCQLTLYMLNEGTMPGWSKDYMQMEKLDNKADFVNQQFFKILKCKKSLTLHQMAKKLNLQ